MKGIKRFGSRTMLVAVLTGALVTTVALFMVDSAGGTQGPTVYLSPASQWLAVGKTATVDIMIKDGSGLYGTEVRLSFDRTLLEVQDADTSKEGVQIAPASARG